MKFLELVQYVRSRVGMQGTGPASVTSATTAEMDLVNAVSDAWIDIQNFREDWRWMRSVVTFDTVVGTANYPKATIFPPGFRHKRWLTNTAYINVSGSKRRLWYLEYDAFIEYTLNSTENTEPSYFTIVPSDSSILIEKPKDIYSITIGYQKSPQILINNADIPELPESFHLLIVYEAVDKYGVVSFSPELQGKYSNQYDVMLGQLLRNQLPSKTLKVRGIV